MLPKKNKKIENISDEQLMDYADNELDDSRLIAIIEASEELQERLIPFKNTLPLITQLKVGLLEEAIPEKLNINKLITNMESKSTSKHEENAFDSISQENNEFMLLKKGILDEPVPDAMRAILDNELNKNNSIANQKWSEKIKLYLESLFSIKKSFQINLGSILAIDGSSAFAGMAASALLVVGIFMNFQTSAPEWQIKYAAMGYNIDTIDSSNWFQDENKSESYPMPINSQILNNLTLSVGNSAIIGGNDSSHQGIKKEITPFDEYLSTIDTRLENTYMIGVLHDMTGKEVPFAMIEGDDGTKVSLTLYGKNTEKENCILGELSASSDPDNPQFFNFCSYEFANPIQLLD